MKHLLLLTTLLLVMGCSVKKHPATSEWSGSEIHAGGTILLPDSLIVIDRDTCCVGSAILQYDDTLHRLSMDDSLIAINTGIRFSNFTTTITPFIEQQPSYVFQIRNGSDYVPVLNISRPDSSGTITVTFSPSLVKFINDSTFTYKQNTK